MNYVSANNKYHVPLHVNPILLKKGWCNQCKGNYYFEALQIGDL